MFFLDGTGFFSLVCLFIQCLMAWVFVGFFAGIRSQGAPWQSIWRRGYLGLALALTAIAARFLLAHQHVADVRVVGEGAPLTRLLQAIYLAGKFTFLCCLASGVAGMRGVRWPDCRGGWVWSGLVVALALGAVAPSVESTLLMQVPVASGSLFVTAWLLRDRPGEVPGVGRTVVRRVAWTWGLIWIVYGVCTLQVGLVEPIHGTPWNVPLRLNSLIDVVLQVALATGLLVVVLQDAQHKAVEAQRDSEALRDQLRRDEQLRSLALVVGGVAHELNNPLTAILGFADDLGDADPEVRRHAARVVHEQADRCRGIVQRLSVLGRRAPVVRQPIDLPALLVRVQAGFAPACAAAGVRIELATAPPLRPLAADPTALEQVVTNLVANAIHASPRGGVVTLRAAGDQQGALIEVCDQGAGVPPELRARLFEPFFTTKAPGQGTGLGLAVARALVLAHGGTLAVGDAVGGGARFTVRLPWGEPSAPVVVPRGADETPARRLQLLVVDDDDMVRETIVRQAHAAGFVPTAESSAAAALARLLVQRDRPDVILCDLRMPGLSGIDLHDRLLAEAPELLRRAVFATGDSTSDEAAAFAERCQAPLVTKPFVFPQLFAELRARAAAADRVVAGA